MICVFYFKLIISLSFLQEIYTEKTKKIKVAI